MLYKFSISAKTSATLPGRQRRDRQVLSTGCCRRRTVTIICYLSSDDAAEDGGTQH